MVVSSFPYMINRFIVGIILIFSLFFSLGCSREKKRDVIELYQNSEFAVARDTIRFPLDSVSIPLSHCFQILPDKTKSMSFCFLNEFEPTVEVYDYGSCALVNKVDLSKFLLSDRLQGFFFDRDTIFTYEYTQRVLSKLFEDKMLYRKYLAPHNNMFSMRPTPFVSTATPMLHIDSLVVFSGLIAGEPPLLETSTNRPGIIIYNEKKDSTYYAVNYPEVYQKYNWGGGLTYRTPYYSRTLDGGKIVVSFPACDELYVYDLADGTIKTYDSGIYYGEQIKPFSKIKKTVSSADEFLWYMNNISYEGIFSNPYKKCYYRIVRFPYSKYKLEDRVNKKPTQIMVMDESFEVTDIYRLPENTYSPNNAFVTENGLSIQVLTANEDEIVFEIFDI